MQYLVDAIIIAWGWRRAALALSAGALSALGFAPFDALPILWITVPVLVLLLDGAVAGEDRSLFFRLLPAALVGWWFGFGFFLAGLWWLGAAFLVDADQFALLMPLAVVLLPACLALFFAFGAALARLVWSDGWPRLIAFSLAMTLAEYLRGTLFTGLPWSSFGYALMPRPVLMQAASLFGLWGMTFFAFLLASAPALLVGGSRRGLRGRVLYLAVILGLMAGDVGYGILRLALAGQSNVAGTRIRLVQPNIDQSEKWQEGRQGEVFRKVLALSASTFGPDHAGLSGVTHLIWPETVFPFYLTQTPEALLALADLLPPGATLIAGAIRAEPAGAPDRPAHVYNSVYVINDAGEIEDAYDKVHLVPFGEFLPFQSWLEALGFAQLTRLPGGFASGAAHRLLATPGAPPFAPLICYEAIFPNEAAPEGKRPGWLVNLTNDAWYGDTPGPRQHFRQAVIRAVEQGLPLVRAANSGISAIVDPFGREIGRIELGQAGILDGMLPEALPPTPYAAHGGLIVGILLVIAASIGLLGRSQYRD